MPSDNTAQQAQLLGEQAEEAAREERGEDSDA